jgi:hypothetical protein
MKNAYRILVGKSEGERPLVTSRRGREDVIKTGFEEIGCECDDLFQEMDRWPALVITVMVIHDS